MPTDEAIPSVTDVDQISALADPVIRNLQITQCYHELALALTARSGLCANWCSFATWASKQAGQTIRKQDLTRVLQHIAQAEYVAEQVTPEVVASAQALGSTQNQAAIQQALAQALSPLGPLERASDAVGRGNKKVFEEIGREFARFIAACLDDQPYDPARVADFCESLRPGDPPDGQQYLKQAFTRYYAAFFESDALTRAQMMLLANIEIGYHEQTRLQPEIAEAMNAAVVDYRQFRQQLIESLFPNVGGWVRLRLWLLRLLNRPSPFDFLLDALLMEARRAARLVITEYLMSIDLPPDLHLRLGQDVLGSFPDSLQQISLPDLRALLDQLDPTPDSTAGSGAVDWANLPQRLHFIIDLFRCYQESANLFDAPFAPDQVMDLKAGRLPEGRL